MGFPSIRMSGCFPEPFGFVLLDPARLDQALGGTATGRNVLDAKPGPKPPKGLARSLRLPQDKA
ncbi:MAG: hypothetical protein HKP61_14325 [Dactylosporangium sp.]|nr:hypothetical protein [Dactylosporangium sp.]NNJ62087.1 hypothetical protein [Dactylosporangium sp.]